jgi:outer membrane protein assembly factor BamB
VQTRHDSFLGGIGPRSTPTIHQGKVYALGATGILRCLDGATGRQVWSQDLLASVGLTPEEDLQAIAWGRAASPLIVDRLVVVPLGGPAAGPHWSLAAFDAATGRPVWKGGGHQASYCSPGLATLDGQRQILIVNQDYASGHEPETGDQLWEHPWPGTSNRAANVSQAVALPENRVLLSKGYGGGAVLLRVTRADSGGWQVVELWDNWRVLRTKFSNVVVRGDHVYGLSDRFLECVDLQTGQATWKAGRYGYGQILGVDELLLVQAESGDVFLVEANPVEHRELGRLAALDGQTWNNPSLFGKLLLVRNAEQAACYELP